MTREEAIEVYNGLINVKIKEAFEFFAPELRESEDEMMEKAIVDALLSHCNSINLLSERGYQIEDVKAWLEKQKEQKPKFYPGAVIKCTSSGSLWVRCKDGDNIRSDGHTACIGGGFELASEEEAVQFFQELNENGYQWDCVKGRPIKKEQKPNYCHYGGDPNIERCKCCSATCSGRLADEQKLAECSEVELTFRGEKVKVKRQFFRDDKGRKYSTTEQDEDAAWYALRAWCEKKGVSLYDLYPREEWSEEDKKIAETICKEGDLKPSEKRWLKSLPERFNLQPKQEWSEEDEKWFEEIELMVLYFTDDEKYREKFISWLKSLKNRGNFPKSNTNSPSWSEEDEDFINMLILHFNYLIDKGGDSVETYKSYIEKLKSLRPQPKQEWSKIDEQISNGLIKALENLSSDWLKLHGVIKSDIIIAWLKCHHNHLILLKK